MSDLLQYDASAADAIFADQQRPALVERLTAAREALFADAAGDSTATRFSPLDAGFVNWPERLLHDEKELERIETTATRFRKEADDVILLGIGGSAMGPRAIFSSLCDPYHNERTGEARRQAPRFYFEGDNLDNNTLVALLERLAQLPDQRWHLVVTSKSGGTVETAVALRIFLASLESHRDDVGRALAVITGEESPLRGLATALQCQDIFTIPESVGGRFSVLTAVGMLPSAIMGVDIRRLLEGAATMTAHCREAPLGENPVLDHAATGIIAETQHETTIRVLSVWSRGLESLGLWHDQLLSESLGKDGRGATPLTAVNTRDLHSRGQQHQQGRRDKLITNLLVEEPQVTPLVVPPRPDDLDDLNRLAGRTIPELLDAAVTGTNQAYAEDGRPTADIRLPRLDEFGLGQLMQMLMLSTAIEGYATGINPFGQPGVEAYKRHMQNELDRVADDRQISGAEDRP